MNLFKLIVVCILGSVAGWSQTVNLYLRPLGDSHTCSIIGASNATPVVITCRDAPGFVAGDQLVVANVHGMTSPNGDRLVRTVLSPTTFSIEDLSHTAIAPNGTWDNGDCTNPSTCWGGFQYGSLQLAAKVNTYTLKPNPRIMTDPAGRSGVEFAAKISSGLLTSVTVSGGIPTVHYAVSIAGTGIIAGVKIGIWGSATSALNSSSYVVASVTSTTVVLSSTSAADGTYTDSSLTVSAWAVTGNPAWDVIAAATMLTATQDYNVNPNLFYGNQNGQMNLATRCYINELDATACTRAVYFYDHFEQGLVGGSFGYDETSLIHGTDGDIDYAGYAGVGLGEMHTLLSSIGKVTTTEQNTFASKVMNDIDTSCTKPTRVNITGTITNVADGTATPGGAIPHLLTGSGTAFTTELTVGDSLTSAVGTIASGKCQITAIADNTHLTCFGTQYGTGVYSRLQKWTAGQCGLVWYIKHHPTGFPSQPADYPAGSDSQLMMSNTVFTRWHTMMGVSLALSDNSVAGARARLLLEANWAFYVDWLWPLQTQMWAAGAQSGGGYDWARTLWMVSTAVYALRNSVVNGPDVTSRDVFAQLPRFSRYILYPDTPAPEDATLGNVKSYFWGYGGLGSTQAPGGGFGDDAGVGNLVGPSTQSAMNPIGTEAGKFMYWLRSVWPGGWAQATLGAHTQYISYLFLTAWPTIPSVNYTSTEPTAGLIKPTANQIADCNAQSPATGCFLNGSQELISKTAWTGSGTSQLQLGCTQYSWDHNIVPRCGEWSFWKRTNLIGADNSFRGYRDQDQGHASTSYNLWQVGTSSDTYSVTNQNTIGAWFFRGQWQWLNGTTRLYSGNFDRFHLNSGHVMYSRLDLTSTLADSVNPTSATREWIHFSDPAKNEYVVEYSYLAVSSGNTIIGDFIHYEQNGETAEGLTTCPAAGGCAAFSTTKEILSKSTVSGIHSLYFAPSGAHTRVYLNATNGTYPGGLGHSFRVSACTSTDGVTCDTNATGYEMVQVHKVFDGTADPGISATQLSPDANWTGIQTEDGVTLFARKNAKQSSVSYTSSYSGTGQNLVAGLNAGVYAVKRNGVSVTGSPFTVVSTDTALDFSSLAGNITVAVDGSVTPVSLLCPTATALQGTAYLSLFVASGGTGPFTYAVTSGSLPAGLSLNTSTGSVTGTPTSPGTSSFSVRATDSLAATGNVSCSLVVSPAASTPGGSSFSGGFAGAAGCVVR